MYRYYCKLSVSLHLIRSRIRTLHIGLVQSSLHWWLKRYGNNTAHLAVIFHLKYMFRNSYLVHLYMQQNSWQLELHYYTSKNIYLLFNLLNLKNTPTSICPGDLTELVIGYRSHISKLSLSFKR